MLWRTVVTLAAVLVTVTGGWELQEKLSVERMLFDDLAMHYDASTRPVLNASMTLHVNFSMSLHQIMDLDVKNQTLITHAWIYEAAATLTTTEEEDFMSNEEWMNEIIHWDPEDYDGLEFIIVPSWAIWVPDLYIFNNADDGDDGFVLVNDSRATVYYDGRVEWVIPLMIKSSCAVDITYFPFDNQRCFIRFGSWIYDILQIELLNKLQNVDMSNYIANNEYHLINTDLEREIMTYEVFSGTYPQITLRLYFRRKPLYYSYTVLVPVLVLCFLTLFSYFLPCDDGNKVGIGLTVFLSLYVLQLAIAETMPESDSLPLIGLFLTLVMTLNSISLLFSTLIINIKKKGERIPCPEVPNLLMKLCQNFLAKITCTTLVTYYDVYDMCSEAEAAMRHAQREEAAAMLTTTEEEDFTSTEDEFFQESMSHEGIMMHRRNRRMVRPDLGRARRSEMRRLYRNGVHPRRRKQQRDLRLEWYFVASTIDKTLFIIFMIAMFLTVMFTLVIVPYMNRDY